MTNVSDIEYVHVLEAEFPSKLIEMLDNPHLATDEETWPTIKHKKVPFKPYTTFQGRLIAELLALSGKGHGKRKEKVVEGGVGKRKRIQRGSERRSVRQRV